MVDLLSSLDHFQNDILVRKNKIQSKESETEQKHNAVLQELEDDYEKRLADKARQLEDKVKIWYTQSGVRLPDGHLHGVFRIPLKEYRDDDHREDAPLPL